MTIEEQKDRMEKARRELDTVTWMLWHARDTRDRAQRVVDIYRRQYDDASKEFMDASRIYYTNRNIELGYN